MFGSRRDRLEARCAAADANADAASTGDKLSRITAIRARGSGGDSKTFLSLMPNAPGAKWSPSRKSTCGATPTTSARGESLLLGRPPHVVFPDPQRFTCRITLHVQRVALRRDRPPRRREVGLERLRPRVLLAQHLRLPPISLAVRVRHRRRHGLLDRDRIQVRAPCQCFLEGRLARERGLLPFARVARLPQRVHDLSPICFGRVAAPPFRFLD